MWKSITSVTGRQRLARLWPLALFGAIFVTVTGLVLTYELEQGSRTNPAQPFPWNDVQRDSAHLTFLSIAALGCLAHGVLRRYPGFWRPALQRSFSVGLAALTFVAGLTYFYGAHGFRDNYPHLHDSFHYLLGAKYYDEVGYDGLYVCTAQALTRFQLPDETDVRDLATDRSSTAGELRGKANCQDSFSAERWAEFKADVLLYHRFEPQTVRRALTDRGYNGSPLQTFIAGALANSFPLTYSALSVVTLLDVGALCAALAFLCFAFGSRMGLLCALLFFSEFVDRHMIIGNSFLRYQWLAALFVGVAALKLRRYTLAGVFMAIATSFVVFPVLFAAALVAKTVQTFARTRQVPGPYRRFFGGAIVAGTLCFAAGAAHGDGLHNYEHFRHAMKVHNAAGRAPGFGVGLKYNLTFRGEFDKPSYGFDKKAKELKIMRPVLIPIATILLLWTLLLALRLDDVEGAVLTGFSGLFCIFGPTGYYFAFAALLVLLWHRRARDPGGLFLLFLLFALSLLPLIASADNHRFFVFNTVVSSTYTLYLLAVLTYLGTCTRLFADGASKLFAPSRGALAQGETPLEPRVADAVEPADVVPDSVAEPANGVRPSNATSRSA